MKAIQLHAYGLEQVRYEEVAAPQAVPGQVLVRVRAATVNPIDVKKASGALKLLFPLRFPWIPGADFAGTVTAVGDGVSIVQPGTDVFGYAPADEAFAEYVVVPAAAVVAKPINLSFAEAAAMPVAVLTAWQGLMYAGHLQAGQTALIHGTAGGVGAYAVHFAHQLGARVIATATQENLDFVRSLGADEVIDYQTTRFETVGRNVDVVLDLIGGDTPQRSCALLKPGGYQSGASTGRGRETRRIRPDVADAPIKQRPSSLGAAAANRHPQSGRGANLPFARSRAGLGRQRPPPACARCSPLNTNPAASPRQSRVGSGLEGAGSQTALVPPVLLNYWAILVAQVRRQPEGVLELLFGFGQLRPKDFVLGL